MTVLVWWAIAAAVVVVLARLLAGPVRRGRATLARRRQARQRAEALLLAWLSPDQRAQYRSRRWRGRFEVTTAAGHRYRVCPGGVVGLDPRGWAYCIEATTPVPVADELLALKLLLETDEQRFLAIAHRYPYH
jgi:heme exporter protein D